MVTSSPHGSSPRSRGTFIGTPPPLSQGRFIPALAGNISGTVLICPSVSVHPRARGEHFHCPPPSRCSHGSSPRSRGTWQILSEPVTPITVHPRARGEHTTRRRTLTEAVGSSPRSRGTSDSAFGIEFKLRFIPALAGNIVEGGTFDNMATVHPRARGEHRVRPR